MKRRFLSLIFLAVSVIFCSCKFNSLFNENASISISLPFGNSRAGDSVKYSFVVDCFEGAEVSESPKYTQKSESGKVINFNNVTPGTYTVRVLAYEFEDFDNLLYEGHETKNVVEDSVTKFVIMMKKVESKGDVMNTMILAKNKVWMQIQETEVDLNYTAITDGAKAINYYWYLNDLYLEEFTSKNELLISEDFVTKHQLCDTNTYTVVAEFEDGTFDSFTFNYYMNLYGLDKFGNYNDLFNEYLKRQKVFTEYSNDIINTTGYSNTGKPGLDYQLALNIYSNFEIKAANIQLFKDSEHKNKTDQVLNMKVNKETSFKEQDLYTLYYSTEDIEPGFYYAVVKVEYSDSITGDTYNSYFSDMIYIGEKLHTYKNVRDTLCFKLPESGQSSGLIETAFVNPNFNLTLNALEEIQTEKYDIAIEAYFGNDKEKQLEVSIGSNYINCMKIFEINLSEINTFPENYPLCLDICVKDISNPDNFAHTILQTTSYSIDRPDPSNYVFTINQDVFANERITLPEIGAETYYAAEYSAFLVALEKANGGDIIYINNTINLQKANNPLLPNITRGDSSQDPDIPVVIRRTNEFTGPMFEINLENQDDTVYIGTDYGALTFDGYNIDSSSPMFLIKKGTFKCSGYEYNISFENAVCNSNDYGSIIGTDNDSEYSINIQDNICFYNNSACYGGAIHLKGTRNSIYFKNVMFSYNKATNYGGAIYINDNTLSDYITFNSVQILNNSAQTGGGIYLQKGNIEFKESLSIKDNSATAGNGGGIYVAQGNDNGNLRSNWVNIQGLDIQHFYHGSNIATEGSVFYFDNISPTPGDLSEIIQNIQIIDDYTYKLDDNI